MRGKASSQGYRGGGAALYLRTRYYTPDRAGIDCDNMMLLSDYIKAKGITRHKADGLLKRHYLLCKHSLGYYWVKENPDNPPTDQELYRRLPKRKLSRNRGMFESERQWFSDQFSKRSAKS